MTAIFTLIGTGLFAITVAAVVRRLLGVPVGWPRSIAVSAVMGLVSGWAISEVFFASGMATRTGFTVGWGVALAIMALVAAWIFAIGLAVLVVLELLLPTGSLPSFSGLIRGRPARRRRARRYRQIVLIATKHGLGHYLGGGRPRRRRTEEVRSGNARTAYALRDALSDAGVTFVKLGQMLATRPDLLPPEFVRALSTLQTDVPPIEWSELQPHLVAALGRPVEDVFAELDSQPLASASVAQVHAGRLRSGERVVVKIQRPAARAQVTADVDIILRLASALERRTVWGADLGIRSLAEGFAAALTDELDYRIEMDNMDAIAAGLKDPGAVRMPAAFREYSSETVLVMEYMTGTPLSAGSDCCPMTPAMREHMATALLREVLHEIMVTGSFHGDLHPGNVFVCPDGTLELVDFGSVGRLDDSSRTNLGLLLLAIDAGDSIAATDAVIDLLDRPEGLADRKLERQLGELIVRYRAGTPGTGTLGMFATLFTLLNEHRFAVPAQLALAFRTLAALEGTVRILAPDFDLIAGARAQGRELGLLVSGSPRELLERQLLRLLPIVERLPRRVNKIVEDLEAGRFQVNLRLFGHRADRRVLTGITEHVIVAIMACACVLGAIQLVGNPTGPMLAPNLSWQSVAGLVLALIGLVLGLRTLAWAFRQRRD